MHENAENLRGVYSVAAFILNQTACTKYSTDFTIQEYLVKIFTCLQTSFAPSIMWPQPSPSRLCHYNPLMFCITLQATNDIITSSLCLPRLEVIVSVFPCLLSLLCLWIFYNIPRNSYVSPVVRRCFCTTGCSECSFRDRPVWITGVLHQLSWNIINKISINIMKGKHPILCPWCSLNLLNCHIPFLYQTF